MKKLILALFCATLLLSVSCGKVETTELVDWQSYIVVRPEMPTEGELDSAITLRKAIQESTGFNMDITTDFVKRGESVPVGTKEILVGATNRPESAVDETFLSRDFQVNYENGRVSINALNDEALAEAVDWFIANCVGTSVSVPVEKYVRNADYPYAKIKLGGVPLSDYRVDGGEQFTDAADELRAILIEKTGLRPKSDGPKIVLTYDDSLGLFESSVSTEGSEVKLAVGVGGLSIDKAVELFTKSLDRHKNRDYLPNEKKTTKIDNVKILTDKQLKEWRDETDAKIESIRNSPNMEIPEGAPVYYISNSGNDLADGKTPATAWKSLTRASMRLEPGSYVCFERGGVWRGQLEARDGVTYTSYGEGPKPEIRRSPYDAADKKYWKKTDRKNIWVMDAGWVDIGTLIFNQGEAFAVKCIIRTMPDGSKFNNTTGEPFESYGDLTTDLHFWHDYLGTGKLYLYSEQNPSERFDSIELNMKGHAVIVSANDVTVDNLTIKYSGSHGVGAGTVENLTVQNCEFDWIGGSIHGEAMYGRTYAVRFGNAVQIYGGCDGFTVVDNYIRNVYDTGITHQFDFKDDGGYQKNIYYARNVIEKCNWSIEYFCYVNDPKNPTRMENILIEDNYMWYAGQGLCEQRPDKDTSSHIMTWTGGHINRAENFVIKNNIMVDADDILVHAFSSLMDTDGSDSMPTFEGNHFAQYVGREFGFVAQGDTTRQMHGAAILDYLGEKSKDDIIWMIEEKE